MNLKLRIVLVEIMVVEWKVKILICDLFIVFVIIFGFVGEIVRKCCNSNGIKEFIKGYMYFSEIYVIYIR